MTGSEADRPIHGASRLIEHDRICDQFESAWRAGRVPEIGDYLPAETRSDHELLLRELLAVEIEQRRKRGERPAMADYAARFPECVEWWDAIELTAIGRAESAIRTFANRPTEIAAAESGSENASHQSYAPRVMGRYRLGEQLGQGGMGTVYRATHTLIERDVAIKVLRVDLERDAAAGQRFLREAQACVRLVHPNIVTVYDVDRTGHLVFMTMELLQGRNLVQYLEDRGRVDPVEAAGIIEQAAEGLAYAHAQGVIHRDVKPHNIMVLADGRVKLLDLGLARILDDTPESPVVEPRSGADTLAASRDVLSTRFTNPGSILGTLAYMAPEQAADSRRAAAQSDIYSLGCTFYFLLTGRHAFGGGTPDEILARHAGGEYQKLQDVDEDFPPELSAIIDRMIAVRPENRFQAARDVVLTLTKFRQTHGSGGLATSPLGGEGAKLEALQKSLVELNLVSGDDWNRALREESSMRTNRTGWDSTTMVPPAREYAPAERVATAISVVYRLQNQQRRDGTGSVLTELQSRLILGGQADLLRLPNHILLERIGQGWKGEVFKARNLKTNRVEVVRTFSPSRLRGLEGDFVERVEQFLVRGQKLAALDHPALAKVYEAGRFQSRLHGELAYLATEYVEGDSLHSRDVPQQVPADTVSWGIEVLLQVCRGLEHAAAQGFRHADLSPLYVKFVAGGSPQAPRIKLLDMGVADLVSKSIPNDLPGRKQPGSPDAATGNSGPACSQADAYGMGCLLLFFLAGREALSEPANGDKPPGIENLETEAESDHDAIQPWAPRSFPGRPRAEWRDVSAVRRLPRQLQGILERLLSSSPQYASFSEIVADLGAIQRDSRRGRAIWKVALMGLGLVVVAASVWLYFRSH